MKTYYRRKENCDIDAVENSSSLLLFLISAALLITSWAGSVCSVLVVVLGPYSWTCQIVLEFKTQNEATVTISLSVTTATNLECVLIINFMFIAYTSFHF